MGKSTTIRVRVRNSGAEAIEFHLEPWGEVYRMPAGATFVVTAEGPLTGDTLEVEHNPDRVTVWGWGESTVTVEHDGEELTSESPLAVVAERTS